MKETEVRSGAAVCSIDTGIDVDGDAVDVRANEDMPVIGAKFLEW